MPEAKSKITVWIQLPDRPDPIQIEADGGCAIVRAEYADGKAAWGCGSAGAGPLDPDGDIPGEFFRAEGIVRRLDALEGDALRAARSLGISPGEMITSVRAARLARREAELRADTDRDGKHGRASINRLKDLGVELLRIGAESQDESLQKLAPLAAAAMRQAIVEIAQLISDCMRLEERIADATAELRLLRAVRDQLEGTAGPGAEGEEITFTESSGNVFADLGLPDVDRLLRRRAFPVWTMGFVATADSPIDESDLAATIFAALQMRGLHTEAMRTSEGRVAGRGRTALVSTLEGTIEVGSAKNGTLVELAGGSPYQCGDVSVALSIIPREGDVREAQGRGADLPLLRAFRAIRTRDGGEDLKMESRILAVLHDAGIRAGLPQVADSSTDEMIGWIAIEEIRDGGPEDLRERYDGHGITLYLAGTIGELDGEDVDDDDDVTVTIIQPRED